MDRRAIAKVDISIDTNTWWDDAFQFGDPLDFTWNFTGKQFYLWITVHSEDTTPVLQLSSNAGTIQITDAVNRVLTMAVPDLTIRTAMSEGRYHYDLIMVDTLNGNQTDGLMYGDIQLNQGITIGPG